MRISRIDMIRIRALVADGVRPPRDFFGYLLCEFDLLVKSNSREFQQYNKDAFEMMAQY